jgi:sugar/nucleoside kinase (ribokinase family)
LKLNNKFLIQIYYVGCLQLTLIINIHKINIAMVIYLNCNRDLLAVGHTAFDYIIKVNDFPHPNSSTAITSMKTFYGGAAANVAMVASKLGLKTYLVSAVGGDYLDSEYEQQMEAMDIDTSYRILKSEDKTPTAFVFTNQRHDQISYFYWGAATHFKESKPPVNAIKDVKAVHLATGDPDFNWRCGKVAHQQGKLISFDPGQDLHMYTIKELKGVLGICDILFGNHHEIDRILSTLNLDIQELQDFGPSIVVKTQGKDGSIIYGPKKIQVEALLRESYDPTGAGDSYRAGFLKAYLEGQSLDYCGKFASAVASFIVEAEGCQTNIPSLDMVETRMAMK